MTYSLCGVGVHVRCHHGMDDRRLLALLRELFVFEPASGEPDPCLELEFSSGACPTSAHPSDEIVSQSRSMTVARTEVGYCLRLGESCRVDLDLTRSRLVGVLDEHFWTYPVTDQRELFLLSLLMLMHRHGRYGLHANGLAKCGIGYLMVGASGSGKTTLSLALVRRGWKYLSDDALALRQTSTCIEALALRRGFSCTGQTSQRFSELLRPALNGRGLSHGKRLVNVESVYSGRFVERCAPCVLLFPKVVGGPRSELIPLDETRAMLALIEQSPGVMTGRSEVAKQLKTLRLLLRQSRSFEIRVGLDVYESGASVSRLIEECGAG